MLDSVELDLARYHDQQDEADARERHIQRHIANGLGRAVAGNRMWAVNDPVHFLSNVQAVDTDAGADVLEAISGIFSVSRSPFCAPMIAAGAINKLNFAMTKYCEQIAEDELRSEAEGMEEYQ